MCRILFDRRRPRHYSETTLFWHKHHHLPLLNIYGVGPRPHKIIMSRLFYTPWVFVDTVVQKPLFNFTSISINSDHRVSKTTSVRITLCLYCLERINERYKLLNRQYQSTANARSASWVGFGKLGAWHVEFDFSMFNYYLLVYMGGDTSPSLQVPTIRHAA